MRTPLYALAAVGLGLTTLVACGDKDDDTGHDGTHTDGGGTDGGGTDGGGTDGGGTDGGGTDGGTAAFDCETETWAGQTAETKGTFMYNCVVPVMKPLFQEYDSDKYADFGCATCHGTDFAGGTYEMPAVWPLDWSSSGSWPDGAYDFMNGSVAPTMAGILGYDPYDPKTGEGFGCGGCHSM